MTEIPDTRPVVVHVVYRFDVGGLENGVVNLINHMPREAYRHVVVSLTEVTDFRKRILRDDVEFIALHKPPGHALWIYPRLFRLFRSLKPAIVHSRNLAALEVVVPAWAAGVPIRIHSEHGREGSDLVDTNFKYRFLRKIYRPFVTYYLALSRDLENYLNRSIGIPEAQLTQIYNGVDTARFYPVNRREVITGSPFNETRFCIVGTVGRFHQVKNQIMLVKAFGLALKMNPMLKESLRLIMVGDGPQHGEVRALVGKSGLDDFTWMPGTRQDIPEILRGLNFFVLPSLSEGISNTILEAMATGLPVIATDVGGNGELVESGLTGELVPVDDIEAMAGKIAEYAGDSQKAGNAGVAGRALVEKKFSLSSMTKQYQSLYDRRLMA